ncbi:MAG: biotin transporter BioY [Candidatus Gastranaerophilales bacterium]|nr:biotin transporter BioY [Candidatus Gastranaerophilales bacterium]
MINKRLKAGIKKIRKPDVKIRFCFGTMALVFACVMLLIIATFTQIKINFNIPDNGIISYLKFEYIPQIPVVIFIAALLGEYWGLIAVLIYIFLGLSPWYPIFALGGGLSYVFQYNFGYIFAFIFAVLFTSKELKNSNSVMSFLLSVLYGVFAIHITGILYLIVIALIRHDSWDFIYSVIYFQSLSKILYDIVFGFLAVLLAKGCRKLLWIIMG